MDRYRKLIFMVSMILLCLTAGPAFSAVYFIDYGNGSDTNYGTSTATPWKHSPGDTNATGNAASTTPSAGDIIVFKGGVTYAFSGGTSRYLDIKSSGTSGNPITYISGHVYPTPWPNSVDRAIIDGANVTSDASSYGVVNIYNKYYITIKGFEIKNQPINGTYGLIGVRSFSWGNIIIDNCVLHNTNGAAVMVHGLYDAGTYPGPLDIRNCRMYDSWGHLVFLRYGTDYVTIENNSFDRNGSNPYNSSNVGANAIAIARGGTDISNHTTIRGNDINQTLPLGKSTKSHILLYQTCHNLLIEDNSFHGTPAVCAIDHVGPITNEIIRNNVFNDYPTQYEGILRYLTDQGSGNNGDQIKIYNNTFVSTPKYGAIIYFHRGNSTDSVIYTNVDIRNNIFDTYSNDKQVLYIGSNSASSGPVVQMSSFTCDYNAYYAGTNPTPFYAWTYGNVNFVNWKTYTARDSNSVVAATTFVDRLNLKFGLNPSDTTAQGKGTTLAGFSTDMKGTSRSEGLWDIGAYQGTGLGLYSPTGLSIRVGQ